jgi:transposase-like protein
LKGDVVKRYEKELPTAVHCFVEDFEACIAYLRFPLNHRRSIRTTNLLERLFEEERRRTKVIPHAFGERPLMKLMFAARHDPGLGTLARNTNNSLRSAAAGDDSKGTDRGVQETSRSY